MDLSLILPALGGTAWTLFFAIIALSIIVAVHEYGHYIVGRWCGIHAETFSIGFGKVLFARTDKHGTQWQIAALPLGGYVKFLGDANAASVGSDGTVSEVDARRTMTGAPIWARSLTVAAGPMFNFILAGLIFASVMISQGERRSPMTFGEARDLPASFDSELQNGDEILEIAGIDVNNEDPNAPSIDDVPATSRMDYLIRRDGVEMIVDAPYPVPPLVASIYPRSAADDAGVRKGDVITAINGIPISTFAEIVVAKDAAGVNPMALTILRDAETLEFSMTARQTDSPILGGGFETRYLIGIGGDFFFEEATDSLPLTEALMRGTVEVWDRITISLSGIKAIMTGQISTCNLSGPVGIAETAGSVARQGAESYIVLIGMISVGVGLLNLFPIPILDGGHLVFHAYEAVARRKPSETAMRILMFIGLAIVLTFTVFAVFNDVIFCP